MPLVMPPTSVPRANDAAALRAANRRTALVLTAIAIIFFAGIIATQFLGGPKLGIGILGSAVLLFLVVAILRNLREQR